MTMMKKAGKTPTTIMVMMFSDYSKKVTLQNLYHDGGFSNVGVSQEIIDSLE